MKKILILLCCLGFTGLLQAQNTLTLPNYAYLYQLNENHVKDYREGKFKPDTLIQTKAPSDSVLLVLNSYTYLLNKRSFGYFLQVKYNTLGSEMSMMLVSPVRINAYRFEDVLQVYMQDSSGFIDNFTLTHGKKSYSIAQHCRCIEIPSKKLPKGTLTVHHGDAFYVLDKNDFAPPSAGKGMVFRKRRFGFLHRDKGPFEAGFIVLNQSEYRHLDSLHAKAYLMDRKGRPIKGEVMVQIEGNNGYVYYKQEFEAKKLSDGAYSLDWQIPDSLQLDQTYTLTFSAMGKSGSVKSTTFRVTHYAFVNYKIHMRQSDRFLLPNDSAFLIISATDQNDIPLPGTKVDLHFRFTSSGKLQVPYLSLPDSLLLNLLDTSIYLEPEKETWFRVPQFLLPYLEHSLQAELVVTTPNNEIQSQSFSFHAVQQFEEYGSELRHDTLFLFLKRNKRKVTSDSVIIRLTDRFYSETQEYKTVLPHAIPNARHYASIYTLDTNQRILLSYNTNTNWVNVNGTKTRDSLYLNFKNGSQFHLQWELYRKGKRFLYGSSDSLAIPLKGNEPVQVLYRYVNGNQMFYGQQVITPATQELRIVHNLPAIAYPGQKIVAELSVYDFDGKPVKNANITGVSINSQMPVITPPVVPYFPKVFGKQLRLTPLNFTFRGYTNQYFSASDTAVFHNQCLNRHMHFRLYFSPLGLHQETLPSKDTSTQLQVVVYESGNFQVPREIWVDDEIRFLVLGSDRQRNALAITPGKHKIAIRTQLYFIEIDSVWIPEGAYTVLGINELRMDATSRISYQKIQQAYEDQELEKIEEQVLFLTIKGYSGDSWIRQDSTILQVPSGRIYLREYQNYGYYGNIGPLKEGMVEWFTKDTSIAFYFNPEMIYTLDSGKIRTNPKTRLSLANARMAQTTGYFSFMEVLGMAELQRRWFVEDSIADAQKNRQKIIQRPRTPSVNQFEAYQGHGGTSSLEIQDGDKALVHRDFIWMENLNEPRYSHYVQQGSYYFSTLKPGLYRLVTGSFQQEMIEVDSLVIDTLCRTYIRLDLLAKPLDPAHWASMQYHYFQTLNKFGPARVPIYDAYTLTQESPSSNKKGEVSGTALINLGPASSAYVLFIHQNGQNRYLSVANNQGHFRMYDMEAGRYWVQIISAYRQVFFAKEINLKNGSQLNLQLDCITDTSLIKKITPNFQNRKFNRDSAVYIDEEGQFASLEGYVYNVVNNERLQDAQIRVTLNGVIMGGARTDDQGYFHVCCLKPGKYQVEVLMGGYQNLIVKDVDLRIGKRLRYNYALLENELISTYFWDFGDGIDEVHYSNSMEPDMVMNAPHRTLNAKSLSVQGGRTDGTAFYINGIRATGSVKEVTQELEDVIQSIDEKARLDEIARDPSANKIRKEFQTNAFWVPNLITGKDGKTAFTYTLPDDQTQWINYLVAINRKQQTNLNTSYTRSYKPLSASLRVPEFVVAGDKIEVAGTVRNLTGDSIQIVIRETLAGIQKEKSITVGGYIREAQLIDIPSGKDTLTLSYTLQYGNYIDGEERNIRVLSNKVYDRKVQTQLLGTEESVQINFNPEAVRRSIRLQSGLRDLLEEEIMNLKRYQYGCVEQTASKLYAMLREIQLRRALNEVFDEKQEVVFLIKRLEEFQNRDGSWGWWKGSSGTPEMTLYVAKALLLADQEGFSVKGHKKGAGQLINTYSYLKNDNKLATLLLARELEMKLDYEVQVAELAKKNLSIEGKMYLIELQIRMGLPYSLKPITDNLKTDARGNVYMDGESRWGFNAQLISLSMQAYQVLRLAGGQESTLLKMRKFLFNNLGYVRRNTFERAAIINTLSEEIKASGGAIFEVKLGEKILYTGGTYTIEGNSVKIENLGAGISVIAIEEFENQANTKQIQGITLNTEFLVKNKGTYQVKSGEISTLQVKATVSKYQKYLVLNVPIPAGCQIISKPTAQGRETAREYFADHIVIYFEDLPKGEYTFDFYLLPQFNGTLTLMPALMEQMYEPEFFGREMKRMIRVE
ncbi:MAG TPA: hypothetical protein DIW47_13100 [Bacteroidetes bacterium]|nr:hypothetical protein [Bacteroidota bacterium]